MNFITFAIRNILRNRRRSLLACLSVFLSILLIVVLQGLTEGFMDSLVRNYTKNETGHINITTKEFRQRQQFMPVDTYIHDSDLLVAKLEKSLADRNGRTIVEQRIRFGVLLSSGPYTKQAIGIAGDPGKEKSLLMLNKSILPGGTYCDAPGTVILGETLALDLHLKPGDFLRIVTQKSDGGLGFTKLSISGIFKTGVNSLDSSVFQLSLDSARDLLSMDGGAQEILIMLPDYHETASRIDSVRKIVDGADPSLSVFPWTSIGDYPKLILMANAIYYWIWFIVAFLGAFIIANVMTMAVLERKREIGILMALGMPRRSLVGLFLVEGTMLGLVGSLAGAIVGVLFDAMFSKIGFDMTKAMAGFSWPVDNVIYPSVSVVQLVSCIALGTITAMIVSWMPSRKAAKLSPVDAIKSL
jgi:putative ABC transport system permease protein